MALGIFAIGLLGLGAALMLHAIKAIAQYSIRPLCNRSARELLQPLGQFVELPLARQCRGLVPARRLFADRGKRRAHIHRGDTLVEEQVFRLASKTAGGDRLFGYLAKSSAAPFGPTPRAPGS